MTESVAMDVTTASNVVTVHMPGNEHVPIAVHIPGNEPAPRRRLRSLVWNDFTKEKKPDGNCVAICNHCKKQLSASSRSGTTHLKNHLATCTNTKVRVKRKKLLVRRLRSGEKNDPDLSHFDQESSRRDLARMIILHGYPFTIVHHAGFKTFVRNLQPQFKLMTHDVVKADCMRIYDNEREKLRESLERIPCRLSLTIEMWRSSQELEYVCLLCHYVDDDWKLKKRFLNFLHVENSAPGDEISRMIAEKLLDWNIHRKLFSVLVDHCNESDVVARELPEFVLLKGSLPLNGDLFHVRSVVPVMNAIAQDVVAQVDDIVCKVRDSVQYVRSSQAALNAFQIAARKVETQQKELVIDDPNNWVTTKMMLENACNLQDAFACLAENDGDYTNTLSSEEWDLARDVTEHLSMFVHLIEKFSAAKTPTSNLFFNDICGIRLLLKTWRASELSFIATVASRILENFEQYWGATVLVMALASILDPRYKMKSIEYFYNKVYDEAHEASTRIDDIRNYLVNLYNEYVIHSNNTTNHQAFLCYYRSDNSGNGGDLKPGAELRNSSRVTLSDAQRGLDQYLQETSSSQPQKSDLDLYLEEPVYPSKVAEDNFNILAWWKFHAAKYPVLSMMARDILAIPVSPGASVNEGRELNQYLSSVDPETAQGLICGQDWLEEEFDVQTESVAPADNVGPVPMTSNLDGDIELPMVSTTVDDFSIQNRDVVD